MSIKFLYENKAVDTWTLSRLSAAAGYPVDDLKNPDINRPWRSTSGAANEWIEGNSPSIGQSINSIAIINHNQDRFVSRFKIDLWFGAPLVFSNTYDSYIDHNLSGTIKDNIDSLRQYSTRIIHLPSTYLTNRWRVTFLDSNSSGYHEIGRIFVTKAFTPIYNFQPDGIELLNDDQSKVARTEGKQFNIDAVPWNRNLNINMSQQIDVSDFPEWAKMIFVYGKRTPFVVDPFPRVPDSNFQLGEEAEAYDNLLHQMYGTLNASVGIKTITPNVKKITRGMTVQEWL